MSYFFSFLASIETSVLEAEIHPLVPFVLGRGQVVEPLVGRHGVPPLGPAPVAQHIVRLYEQVQGDVHADHAQQRAVAARVVGRVVGAVDVGAHDGAGLHKHVVAGGRDGAEADRVGVARVPADLDGVG